MRVTKDLVAGGMFCAFGLGAAIVAYDWDFGTPARMGPAFFPTVVGSLIAILGAALVIKSLANPAAGEPIETFHLRPLFFISASIVSFGLLIRELGLIPALVALILIARFAGKQGSMLELVVMVVTLIAVSVGIFIYGLNIYLRLWIWP